ncbi:MAG: pyridoxal-phosphate dependent enzyme [Vulcanimicrobiota bacterium]
MFSLTQLEEAWISLPPEIKNTPYQRARQRGVTFKLESLQPTGSYKIRAAYRVLQRSSGQGVALSSSGNFAGAFTWAASQQKKHPHLVVTPGVNQRKMQLARRHPCTVHICGDNYESRFEMLSELRASGVEAIDHRTDREVFLGHSTIGWELLTHTNHFQRVLIPVSTGGLALGVASALRAGGFRGEILGVQPSGNPTLYESWRSGQPIQRNGIHTICDALTATSIPQETFNLLQQHLDDILLVQEQSVWNAVGYLALEEGLVSEPGAAVGTAALLEEQIPWERSLCILSGANIEALVLKQAIDSWFKASM